MKLSLSVRIAEGFSSKEEAILDIQQLADVAVSACFDGICMRASQVGVHSTSEERRQAKAVLDSRKLGVTMVTGDFDVVYNNELGPNCLRNIAPYLSLAKEFGAPMIRVAIKEQEDIEWAQRAADQAAEQDIKLVHQCHTRSLFETVESIESTLQRIDRPNFGLIYEPANLEICGQPYGAKTVEQLSRWIFNVYLQNQILRDQGSITLKTWCRGPVPFDLIQIHDSGGLAFPQVFQALEKIDYQGTVTVHQSAPEGQSPLNSASHTAEYLRQWVNR